MAVVETYPERYADPLGFAREVNLPLLGSAHVRAVPAGAGLAQLLEASSSSDTLGPIVESLTETRRSLTLRSLLLAGFPHDPECFAVGLSIAREWSRRGLRVAVVDLDFWNPTIVRPPSHPNEGLVDVLEYGCSFGRVAWEIVADRLWMIGPGSHPPDEVRIAEHPDWARAGRVFGSCVDVTLYVAPLLDRRGFTGKLSKQMDAAILAASVERVGRADLRDAFLELWGSDAPMIGCVGIEMAAEHAAPNGTADARRPAEPDRKPAGVESRPGEPSAAWESAVPRLSERVDARTERALEAALERDVRRGIVDRKSTTKRGRTGLWVGAAAVLAVAAAVLGVLRAGHDGPPQGSFEARQPAGEEPVASAPRDMEEERGNLDDPRTPIRNVNSTEQPPAEAAPAAPSEAPTKPPAASTPPVQRASLGTSGSSTLPGSALGADPAKPFHVHVASFRTESKVQEIVRTLRARKLDAWFEPPPPGGGWYRVFVGRFSTEAEAKTFAAWLVKKGYVDRAESYPQTKR